MDDQQCEFILSPALCSFSGATLYLSGQGTLMENGMLATGKIGQDVDVEDVTLERPSAGACCPATLLSKSSRSCLIHPTGHPAHE